MNLIKDIDAVILANGEYPSSFLPLQILDEAPYVVCCDGGADTFISNVVFFFLLLQKQDQPSWLFEFGLTHLILLNQSDLFSL